MTPWSTQEKLAAIPVLAMMAVLFFGFFWCLYVIGIALVTA